MTKVKPRLKIYKWTLKTILKTLVPVDGENPEYCYALIGISNQYAEGRYVGY